MVDKSSRHLWRSAFRILSSIRDARSVTFQVAEGARLFKVVFYATVAAYIIDCVFGCGGILMMIFGTYVIAKARAKLGEFYGIDVHPCGNYCLSFWCGCCVVSQV